MKRVVYPNSNEVCIQPVFDATPLELTSCWEMSLAPSSTCLTYIDSGGYFDALLLFTALLRKNLPFWTALVERKCPMVMTPTALKFYRHKSDDLFFPSTHLAALLKTGDVQFCVTMIDYFRPFFKQKLTDVDMLMTSIDCLVPENTFAWLFNKLNTEWNFFIDDVRMMAMRSLTYGAWEILSFFVTNHAHVLDKEDFYRMIVASFAWTPNPSCDEMTRLDKVRQILGLQPTFFLANTGIVIGLLERIVTEATVVVGDGEYDLDLRMVEWFCKHETVFSDKEYTHIVDLLTKRHNYYSFSSMALKWPVYPTHDGQMDPRELLTVSQKQTLLGNSGVAPKFVGPKRGRKRKDPGG